MNLSAHIQLVDFNVAAYRSAIDKKLQEESIGMAKAWLRATVPKIPTWSRASRATFEALANEVGINITYGPIRSKKDRLFLGLSTSNGGLIYKKMKEYGFFYETDLRYLKYNEFNSATPGPPPQPYGELRNPTPYGFLILGRQAANAYAKTVELPRADKYIKGKPI